MINTETSKDQPKAKTYTPQDFIREYDALCKKMGYQIIVTPAYMKRDDSSYSTVIQTSVGPLTQS